MMTTGYCSVETSQMMQKQADGLREEGKTAEALDLYNRALISFQKEHDYKGILEVLCGRLISWQHLFNHEEDKVYAILARKEAEAMLSIAEEYQIHDKDYLIHFLFGKTWIFLKDFPSAQIEYSKAIELYPLENAEKGDWMAHLGEATYRSGLKEEGKAIILKGVQQIQAHAQDVDSFQINVWISGAYLRLAKILINDDIEEAKIYLQKGEKIVNSDPRLVIRKQQLAILKQKIPHPIE
ncbi:MAG: tetratricopeptide repeat protein [Chlamydiales bacterium]